MFQHSPYFLVLEIAVLIVFLFGLVGDVRFWLKGAVGEARGVSAPRKLYLLAQGLPSALRPVVLGTIAVEWFFQRRLLRSSRLSWLMHFCFLWGLVVLFFVGSVGLFLAEKGLIPVTKDTPWFALVNDFAGLVVLFGVGVALYRRFVRREWHLKTGWEDVVLVALLAAIIVSGYLLEASRMIAQGTPGDLAVFASVGYILSLALKPLAFDWTATETLFWWVHVVAGMGFVAYLPYCKLLHLVAAPISLVAANALRPSPPVTDRRRERGPSPSLSAGRGPMPSPYAEGEGRGEGFPSSIEHFSARQLVEMDACTRCGQCVRRCQAYEARGDDLVAPAARLQEFKKLLKREHHPLAGLLGRGQLAAEDLKAISEGAYRCTLCARCTPACPAGIDLRGLWLSVREDLVSRGAYPAGLNLARDAVAVQRNVVNYPNDERAAWVDYMLEAREDSYQRETAPVAYFVGCIASFSPAVQSIPEAFVQVLDRAGLDFTILGDREWCCGFPLLVAGMKREAEAVRNHNLDAIRQIGAKTVVFTCPSCYNTWVNEYSRDLPEVELLHSTQLLARLIQEGRLRLKDCARRITYHDPCDLGRNSGVFEAPRRVLKMMPGAAFVEASLNRDLGLCCGGGGDLEIADPELAGAEARSSLAAFEATGADTLVSACQQCKRMFLAAREKAGSKMQVLDIAEVIFESLQSEEEEVVAARAGSPGG